MSYGASITDALRIVAKSLQVVAREIFGSH
jgi:hypothetical protein